MGTSTLEQWALTCDNSPYRAPETQRTLITGRAYGHPRFDDGSMIIIAPPVSLKGEIFTTKSGSKYKLGDVDVEYEARYPNARERFFISLKKYLQEKAQ